MSKIKILEKIAKHNPGRSYESILFELDGKKFKFEYEAYNCAEPATLKGFDMPNMKWNILFTKADVSSASIRSGVSAYILDADERAQRSKYFYTELIKLLQKLMS